MVCHSAISVSGSTDSVKQGRIPLIRDRSGKWQEEKYVYMTHDHSRRSGDGELELNHFEAEVSRSTDDRLQSPNTTRGGDRKGCAHVH